MNFQVFSRCSPGDQIIFQVTKKELFNARREWWIRNDFEVGSESSKLERPWPKDQNCKGREPVASFQILLGRASAPTFSQKQYCGREKRSPFFDEDYHFLI